MTLRKKLEALSSAEDFFLLLDIPFDPEVLRVARLHILRRMGEYLQKSTAAEDQEYEYELYRSYLLQAYLDFVHSTPLQERVFKVHQQAVAPAQSPLVHIQTADESATPSLSA